MRIVIDLQGAQSSSSRNRGIGRYSLSLAKAIVCNRGEHEVFIALNGIFPDAIVTIRSAFDSILPQENILVWYAPSSVSYSSPENVWLRQAAELIRENFLANLRPDIVLLSSLFEGLGEDVVTSINIHSSAISTAVILYDLIPYTSPTYYLESPIVRDWYLEKIDHLRRASLWLAISDFSKSEGQIHLALPSDRVVNISTAADDVFSQKSFPAETITGLRDRYGLSKPFVMYTGGVDQRKNIEGLIRAFAYLPKSIRNEHQLAIVCSILPESRRNLENLARLEGLIDDELVLTGFVPEEDLVVLYNICKLFVFPSYQEGFGLPALEAMICGAPVIASSTSSLPEVVGLNEALFDPHSKIELTEKIAQALSDEDFRKHLISHGLSQAKKFSWDNCAKRSISLFEQFCNQQKTVAATTIPLPANKPKLAYVSPLPPERSGISDYSAELLPELALHYDIDVIVDQAEISNFYIKANLPIRTKEWLVQYANTYDRVLYHFGNSAFHQHMFPLLNQVPGVVVLHDFFLSGVLACLETSGIAPGAWTRELYDAHGYSALQNRFKDVDTTKVMYQYPCNLSVLRQARGVIVHSETSVKLAKKLYGNKFTHDWVSIPLMRVLANKCSRQAARQRLGLNDSDFLICSFGLLNETKCNERLLNSFLKSRLAASNHCKLIFVGQNDAGIYGVKLLEIIASKALPESVSITGWLDQDMFRDYLSAADVAVQLRSHSRGETSAAVLDCMNFGLPTIVNANGSMSELPADVVWMIPDQFSDTELVDALEQLWQQPQQRQELGNQARYVIETQHDPKKCAAKYRESIEGFYKKNQVDLVAGLINDIAKLEYAPEDTKALLPLVCAIAQTFPAKQGLRQIFVDVSEWAQAHSKNERFHEIKELIKELIKSASEGFRVEPVYAVTNDSEYLYARNFTLCLLECPVDWLEDTQVEVYSNDIFIDLAVDHKPASTKAAYLMHLRSMGVKCFSLSEQVTDSILETNSVRNVFEAVYKELFR